MRCTSSCSCWSGIPMGFLPRTLTLKYPFPSSLHEIPPVPKITKGAWGQYRECISEIMRLQWHLLQKNSLWRKDSAGIKCKQLTYTCQEQHHSYTTQHPHCMFYLKSGIKKQRLRLNNHHLCLLCSMWRNSP